MFKYKRKFTPLLVLILILVVIAGIVVLAKSRPNTALPLVTFTPVPTPQLEKINYKTQDLRDGWTRLTSDNYKFQLDFPNGLELTSKQTVNSTNNSSTPNNLILTPNYNNPSPNLLIGIGLSEYITPNDLKINIENGINININKKTITSSSPITEIKTTNISGFTYSITGGPEGNFVSLNYKIFNPNKYIISLTFSRYIGSSGPTGGDITATDRNIIQQMISSLKFQ